MKIQKTTRTLALHRETLRALESDALIEAVGGVSAIPRLCNPSGRQTCGSCQVTCTTTYC